MITVIEHGNDPDPLYRGRCVRCRALIQCNKSDFTVDDRPCSEEYVLCPEPRCGGHILKRNCTEVESG